MTVEQAIKTALDYEEKVRDSYLRAAKNSQDDTGKRMYKVLAKEEQEHVSYLREKLEELKKTGKIEADKLETVVPSEKAIADGVSRLEKHSPKEVQGSERDLLDNALNLEKETSAFYEKMVGELGKEGWVFDRFIEIEKGHVAIVQAEMDYLNGSGYYFDFQDFAMV
ncbi:MAG: hypothetical protein GY839_14940 [candidate division Zixibacteria bacterium]|nr:hypothetical protein [candidate division Zixibacteria bacterium]